MREEAGLQGLQGLLAGARGLLSASITCHPCRLFLTPLRPADPPPLPHPQEMMYRGCERSVITYSSLISACEKAGQWELALELFQEMLREQCTPNTVT